MAFDDQDLCSETFSEITNDDNMFVYLPVIDNLSWKTIFDEDWTNTMLAQSHANFKKQAMKELYQFQMSLTQHTDMLSLMKKDHTKGTNYLACFAAISCMQANLAAVQTHLLNDDVMYDVLFVSLQTAKNLKTTLSLTRAQKATFHQGRFFSTTGKSDMLLMALTNLADNIQQKIQWMNESYPRKMDDDSHLIVTV